MGALSRWRSEATRVVPSLLESWASWLLVPSAASMLDPLALDVAISNFVRKSNTWTRTTSTAAARAKRPVGSFYLLFRNYSQFPAAPIILKIIPE